MKAGLLFAPLWILSLLLSSATVFAENASDKVADSPPAVAKSRYAAQNSKVPVELPPAELKLKSGDRDERDKGERLDYSIEVNGVPAGKALLEVRRKELYGGANAPEVFVVALEIRSNRAVSLFYNVKALAKSFIDVKGGFSRFFYIDRHEGEIKAEERISFKYDIGAMEATYERPRSDSVWRTYKIPLVGKALDPLAAIYYLRSMPLDQIPAGKEGAESSFFMPICTDRRVWNLRVRITERGVGDFGKLKNRKFIKVVPEAEFKGLFERKGSMTVWLDEATKIPLKMTCEIPIGPAEVLLDEFVNSPLNE